MLRHTHLPTLRTTTMCTSLHIAVAFGDGVDAVDPTISEFAVSKV